MEHKHARYRMLAALWREGWSLAMRILCSSQIPRGSAVRVRSAAHHRTNLTTFNGFNKLHLHSYLRKSSSDEVHLPN